MCRARGRPRAALSHATCPPAPCTPPSRPRAGLSLLLHVAPPPLEPPRLPPACKLLLLCDHGFFWTPSTSWSFPHTPSCFHASAFPLPFSLSSTTPRRTSAAASGRRRQPPTPPPTHGPVLLEHHRDSLQLTDPSNFTFSHPSIVPHSTGELKLRRRSALPLTRCYTTPQLQPRAPAAPHHPVEASQELLHHPLEP
jgi:hypothetical protein